MPIGVIQLFNKLLTEDIFPLYLLSSIIFNCCRLWLANNILSVVFSIMGSWILLIKLGLCSNIKFNKYT